MEFRPGRFGIRSAVAALALGGMTVFLPALRAADAPSDAAPAAEVPETSYEDLSLKRDAYLGKTVRVRGTFHYLESVDPVFQLRMGDQAIDVAISQLPPEAQKTVRDMRNFSETPLTVIGQVRAGELHANPVLLVASAIGVEGSATHFYLEPNQGVVTYPQISRFSQRFIHTVVTMQGRFDFRDPNREMFTLWRGVDSIQVDFSRLSNDVRARLLKEPPFSNQALTVKGIVRPLEGRKGRYMLEAMSVDYAVKSDAGGGDPSQQKETTYGDILADPSRYVDQKVRMRGAFDLASSNPYTLQMRQGGDSMEVIYERIDPKTRAEVQGLADFSGVSFYVTGKVKAYPDAPNRYLLIADEIDLISQ